MIYVSIASYRDRELGRTLESMLVNCSKPELLSVCIIDQDENFFDSSAFAKEFGRLQHVKIPWQQARGAGYARKLAMDRHKDEEYFLQIDSHIYFDESWLERILEQYEQIPYEKRIVSIVPPKYVPSRSMVILEKDPPAEWFRLQHGKNLYITGVRQPWDTAACWRESHTISAAFMFAHSSIIKQVPYDAEIPFWTEEVTMALRAYTRGWRIYAIRDVPLYHFYVRPGHTKIWDNTEKTKGRPSWQRLERAGREKGKEVLLGITKGSYGIADPVLYRQYQDMIGFSFRDHYRHGGL